MLKVSIIMPVYNAGNYLREAIETVLNQTYPNFELLLINDRSSDDSKQICTEYAQTDCRIVLLENSSEFHGPGPTRNIGLDYATGEFIYFMDADDWIEPELLEQTIKRIEKDHSDMVAFGCINEFYGDTRKSQKSPAFQKSIWTREEIQSNILEYWKIRSVSLWSHLIRHEIIGNFRFENIPLSEDICFFLDILTKINSISYLNVWLYHYRTLAGSVCHKWHENVVEYHCVKWTHEKKLLENLCPSINKNVYTEILMMSYQRIIYELALPGCPFSLREKMEKIEKAQKFMEIEKYREYITVCGKKQAEKIKLFLVKNKKEKLILMLGTIFLKWKQR